MRGPYPPPCLPHVGACQNAGVFSCDSELLILKSRPLPLPPPPPRLPNPLPGVFSECKGCFNHPPSCLKAYDHIFGFRSAFRLPPRSFQVPLGTLGYLENYTKTYGFLIFSVKQLGASLGPNWGHLGAILGPSWGHLEATLGLPWGLLGSSWGVLEPN